MRITGHLRKASAVLLVILQWGLSPVCAQTRDKATYDRTLKGSKEPPTNSAQQGNTAQDSPKAAASKPQLVIQLPQGSVQQVAFSPDGRLALTCGLDVLLWHVPTARQLRRFVGHSKGVTSAAFSPDGRLAVSGGGDNTARLWDVATGKEVMRFPVPQAHSSSVMAVAFSPDGRFVLTGCDDGMLIIWEAKTGHQARVLDGGLASGPSNCVRSVAFSPDGRFILTGSNDCRVGMIKGSARLWDAASGKEMRRFEENAREGYPLGMNFVGFSPDSRFALMTVVSEKHSLQLWDLVTDKKIWESHDRVISAAFSPDGKFIVTANLTSAHLLDAATGNDIRRFLVRGGTPNLVNAVAFSPDGRFILTGFKGNALLWDATTGEVARRFESHSNFVSSVAFSPDGRFILAEPNDPLTEKEKAVLWDTNSGGVVGSFELDLAHSPVHTHPTYSADGRFLLLSDGWMWDVSTGSPVRNFLKLLASGGSKERISADRSFAFSPDGRFILISDIRNKAVLVDVATGQEVRRFQAPVPDGKSFTMNKVTFSPDGRFVLSGSDGGLMLLWDVATGSEVRRFEGHEWNVHDVAFSPDGRFALSGSYDRTARLWDVATGSELRRFEGHTGGISSVSFSPDGQYVLTGGGDGTSRLWDVRTGKEALRFEGHSGDVHSARFLPDGRFVLTGATDYTTRLWDASTGRELCRLITFHDGNWAVVDSDGRFDTSNLDEIQDLHWVVPDDPFTPLPVEIFMREYYEPRLLQRILAGERLRPIKSVSELNRVQPKVSITNIQAQQKAAGTVAVAIEVTKAVGEVQRAGKKVSLETGVYDLRLFRDGQLVGYAPENGGEVRLDNTGKATVMFTGIKVPRKPDIKQVEFSAYAFNVDRVKSATDRKVFEVPKDLTPQRGRGYLLTFGVNAYEQESFDLNFAANDARRLQKIVYDKLFKGGEYDEIVQIPLISDYEMKDGRRIVTQNAATKKNLKSVLDLLSGKQVATELIKDIPGADRIKQARPEDLILISFSSHGFADDNGNFYFVPYDTGQVKEERITDQLIKRCISSEELAVWLRDVDAGEMVMIADACHSAATVDVQGFKPGPMGSRGLGQLAYDKRMRILTSTQADDVALESGLIKQGLLTYALTHDGIEAGQADFKPKDGTIALAEWLEYGVSRVPTLYEEVKRGELQSFGQGAEKRGLVHSAGKKQSDTSASSAKRKGYQQPSLFDFSRRKHDIALVKWN